MLHAKREERVPCLCIRALSLTDTHFLSISLSIYKLLFFFFKDGDRRKGISDDDDDVEKEESQRLPDVQKVKRKIFQELDSDEGRPTRS